MKKFSWKTTLFGLTSLLTGVTLIIKGQMLEGITSIATGLGLTFAKDHNVSDKSQ